MGKKEFVEVYCPKEGKKVPIWYCLGSITQGRNPCFYWTGKATVVYGKNFAEVECLFEDKEEK